MINYNFWIMDALTSGLIFASAVVGERRQKMRKQEEDYELLSSGYQSKEEKIANNGRHEIRLNIGYYIFFNVLYFSTMSTMVVALRYYPTYIIYVQHIAVVGFIIISFDGWLRPTLAYPLGILLSLVWFFSGRTAYRWILNNIIIVVFTIMVGDIQFKNFTMLQIFMWSAFVYDVCVLAQGNLNLTPAFFSVTMQKCETLICHLFEMHDKWQLPSVFTVKFGNGSQVFLGTGDILIGALVVNFSKSFFKSTKYVVAVVLSFSLSIGLLSQVDSIPFPALASIVPICTTAIILCAMTSGKTRQLFSLNTNGKEPSENTAIGLVIA